MGNIKKISIPGAQPSPTSFKDDEVVINTADGKIYIKKSNSTLKIVNQDSNKDIPLEGNIIINKKLEFKLNKNSDNILFISASGNNPRVGIGTTEPEATIDFKSVDNSSVGTELVLRTARSATTGAFSGDEGGSINFTIDSSSFTNLKTSGSLAKIKTIVNSIGAGGAQGILTFTLSKGAGPDGIDAFKYGYNIGGEGANFAQLQTGSLIIKDFGSAGGRSKIKMLDTNGVTKLQILNGNITASGDINASGTIYANSADFESNITTSGNISCSGDIIGNINGGTF